MGYSPNFNKELYNWFIFQLYKTNQELGLDVPGEVLMYSAKVLAKKTRENFESNDWLDLFRESKNEFEMLNALKEAGDEKIIRGGWFYESYKYLNLEDVLGLGIYFFQQAADIAKKLNLYRESELYHKISENFEDLIIEIREMKRDIEEDKKLYELLGDKKIELLQHYFV